ncbi:MAG TPA: succinate dehydrogenase, hydrophobic membrane anchor protein [Steroidobacteraceae bacterium]|nr:succinate dehydrogenase, hydrophobic membrane anchor protein [Steroidobacteraceae bacterium]
MSLRTPLAQVRGLGAAGEGVHHWWAQRVTAVALVPLAAWFLVSLLTLPALDYATVSAWLHGIWSATLMVLFVACAAWHSRLGVQVVIEDYVHDCGLKATALVLSVFVHVVVALAGVFAVLRVAFGSG